MPKNTLASGKVFSGKASLIILVLAEAILFILCYVPILVDYFPLFFYLSIEFKLTIHIFRIRMGQITMCNTKGVICSDALIENYHPTTLTV